MLKAPALVEPALELRRALDAGVLFTPLAEDMCGQAITADIERQNPPRLFRHEAEQFGLGGDGNWAALRRGGQLLQSDGRPVAEITSVVLLSRITPQECRALQATNIPLGKVLGPDACGKVLETTLGITEFAVHCRRLILRRGEVLALTTERVLWSWLGQPGKPEAVPPAGRHGFC